MHSSSHQSLSFGPQFYFSFPKKFQHLKKDNKINGSGLDVIQPLDFFELFMSGMLGFIEQL